MRCIKRKHLLDLVIIGFNNLLVLQTDILQIGINLIGIASSNVFDFEHGRTVCEYTGAKSVWLS